MTGYTVHTGSNEKFSSGWDRIFGSQRKPTQRKPTQRKTAAKSPRRAPRKRPRSKSS